MKTKRKTYLKPTIRVTALRQRVSMLQGSDGVRGVESTRRNYGEATTDTWN